MQQQASSIVSEQRALGALLSDKRPLRVPAYQRNFSWTSSEISDLWDDLQGIMYEGHENYFLGSMVFILKPDNSLEVVDGQQRLATVSLLLAGIRDGFEAGGDKERAHHVETHYLCSRNLRTLEASPKLALNEIDNDIYVKIIENAIALDEITQLSKNKESVESNRLIAKTYVTLYELVRKTSQEFSNKNYLSDLVETITENISCIQIITPSEESAYVLFETLNDRGLDLTLSDMLKNFLFSKAGKRIDEVKHKWAETTVLVGQQYMKTFIRHEWMSRFGQTREKELYNKIKKLITSNPKAIEYISTLRTSATIYDATRNPDHELWGKYNERCRTLLQEILLLGPVQCYPLILSTYLAKPDDLELVLGWIISLTVRYSIICGKGTGNLETTYGKASSLMRRPGIKIKDIKDVLQGIWPSDEEFKLAFGQKTLSSPKIIKYLLAKIEKNLSANDELIPNPEVLTVEHILPKKPNQDWPQSMRNEQFIKENCSRIGNLTILTEPMNREAQSKEFEVKKDTYLKSKYKITQQVADFSEWTDTSIGARQMTLADAAVTVWVL
jgi:hypothetical protein